MAFAAALPASAQWQKVCDAPEVEQVFVTSKGSVLVSSWDEMTGKGGIYRSTDNGDNFTKTRARNYRWNTFIEVRDSIIYTPGDGAHVARSLDDGATWQILSFEGIISDYVSSKEMPYVTSYGMGYDPELKRIYVVVYADQVGVVYSDDFGETWQLTDRKTQLLNFGNGDIHMDVYYGAVFFKGYFYALGLYTIQRYLPETNRWETVVKNPNGLCITTEMDGVLYMGHALEIEPGYLLRTTENFKDWGTTPLPAGQINAYVRALDNDGKMLFYSWSSHGVFYSTDCAQTWNECGTGLPTGTPGGFYTALANNDDYLFTSCYSPMAQFNGVFRIAKSELTSGVSVVDSDQTQVQYADNTLIVSGVESADIMVYDTAGRVVMSTKGTSCSLSHLAAGTYIYNVKIAGRTLSGKVVVL
ncbi:MAG: T9SS type A sorting domain-containing protein [Paramuribaculum sp.]|nr:T9SS type A sorting domain-containing protein [Paramuribaculum sp.]MDE6304938.1 T9SS type A sorting domain-containing protein [Paramuribaculum sp.]